MFADGDSGLDFVGDSAGLAELTVAEGDLKWGGLRGNEVGNETMGPSHVDETCGSTGINHRVSVNPVFSRPELDFDYNMQI